MAKKRQKILIFQKHTHDLSIGVEATSTHPSLYSWKFDQDLIRHVVAKMIIIDELPFRFVKRDRFREMKSMAQPRFQVPSRITMTRDCFKIFVEEKEKLKNFFVKFSHRVCPTTDTWTSCQNLNYMCLTTHFIDEDLKLNKKILNFCSILSHKGLTIGKIVESCLLQWKISKILTITFDNASSNDTGLNYLKQRLEHWNSNVLNGDYLHMRCYAHILSLTIKKGLKDMDDFIFRIRSAIRYVRSSPMRLKKFKGCVEQEKIESKCLLAFDVETRWNSTYLMLDVVIKFQRAFDLLEL